MDISIIICTYNPEERIFSRCLHAVQNFTRGNLKVEVLLIDNNSVPKLNEVDYVKQFLTTCPNAKYIAAIDPGLTYARIAGFKHAIAPVIIFFDDDNEPDENYLVAVHEILSKRKEIGVIGPGTIHVDFIDGSNKWLETKRPLFQEINLSAERYDNDLSRYQDFYPYGTGLVIRREVMQEYLDVVIHQAEISDRKGNSLISGGDKQIVWGGLKMGYLAGRTPSLKLNHIISQSRTSEGYIKRLYYYTSYSGIKAYLGVFPENEFEIRKTKKSFVGFYFTLTKCIVRNIFNRKLLATELLPCLIGKTSGFYFAFDQKKPKWLAITEKAFGLNY